MDFSPSSKYALALIALATIGLTGLTSCSTPPKTPGQSDLAATSPSDTTASVKISGSSSAFALLKTLSTQYESTTKNTKLEFLEPAQSENVIAGVKQNIINIGAISKTLKPEDNDGTLESREVARDGLLVATHSSVTGIKNLTTDDLKAIYSGTITNWKDLGGPDGAIVVLDRPEDESAKRLLRKHYLGNDLKNGPTTIVLRREGELIQALQNTPNSIGVFSLAHAISHNLSVNRMSLNGVEPTAENIKAEKYPMVRPIVLVWHKKPSATTQKFTDYIFSAPGNAVLEKSGFVSLRS